MKATNQSILFALIIVLAVAVLSACGGGGKATDQPATNATASNKSGSGNSGGQSGATTRPCPGEGDVAAAVGFPVRSKPYKFGCYYETGDAGTSVSIMSIDPSRADQVLEQMRSAAKPYGAEVVAIDVGQRGYAWSSPAQSQGFAVAGDRAYMLEVVTTGGGGDKKAAVILILKMMIG